MSLKYLEDDNFYVLIKECLLTEPGKVSKEKLKKFEDLNKINRLFYIGLFNFSFDTDENFVTHICVSSPECELTDIYIPVSEDNYKKIYHHLRKFLIKVLKNYIQQKN